MLTGKKIIIGVTGSIAAYKTVLLVRELVKLGAEVQVIMTDDAKQFVTPLTLSTLSKKEVLSSFHNATTGAWNNHVELGLWADVMIIAPLSAHTASKMANGICDNLLMAVYLSARCPVAVAPAMDLDMYAHPSVQHNLNTLQKHGVAILEAQFGALASGLEGRGRMVEPEQLLEFIEASFVSQNGLFKDKKVLITAGPTQEAIDPVRYISNHSSGKMGYALAAQFAVQGAKVTLVSGPVHNLKAPKGVEVQHVVSAQQMFEVCQKHFDSLDIAVFAAAVADYKPSQTATEKIKKQENWRIDLIKNPDIALEFGKVKQPHQRSVGFALETENQLQYAQDKLVRKNMDAIILNSPNDPQSAFGFDTNKVTIIGKDGSVAPGTLKSKSEVANDIVAYCHKLLI